MTVVFTVTGEWHEQKGRKGFMQTNLIYLFFSEREHQPLPSFILFIWPLNFYLQYLHLYYTETPNSLDFFLILHIIDVNLVSLMAKLIVNHMQWVLQPLTASGRGFRLCLLVGEHMNQVRMGGLTLHDGGGDDGDGGGGAGGRWSAGS